MENMDKMFTIIGALMFLVGLALVGITLALALRKLLKIKKSTKTTGIVVDVEISRGMRQPHSSSRNTLYKPTVRFQTADGRAADCEPVTSNSWSNYRVGQNVPVYYDPRQPENAIAGTAFGLWYGLFVFGFVGGFFFLMGTFFVFMSLMSSF